MLPPSLAGWMSSTPAFLLWWLQHTSRPDFPLVNLPIWMLLNYMCNVWNRNSKLLGLSPVFLDFLQKMPAISQKYLDELSPGIRASQQGPRTNAFEHYKMIVTFQHCLLSVIEDVLHLSSLSDPQLELLRSAPGPLSSILLNPVTEAAAVLQLAGTYQFVSGKDLAKGPRKQTQQTKSQSGQKGTSAESSSRRAVPGTALDGLNYTPPDHAAAAVRNGQVAVSAAAAALGERLVLVKAYTMNDAFAPPLKVLTAVVEMRYNSRRESFSQMSLASQEGLKLLLEVAALLAGMEGTLEELVTVMLQTLNLLRTAACGTSFDQRRAFIADKGKLILQVLWRVGKAMSAESQQKQPVWGGPDALVDRALRVSNRAVISIMVEFLDVLVRPSSTSSSIIAGKDTMQLMITKCLQYAAYGGVTCMLVWHSLCLLSSFPCFWVLSPVCKFRLFLLKCLFINTARATGSKYPITVCRIHQCCHVGADRPCFLDSCQLYS